MITAAVTTRATTLTPKPLRIFVDAGTWTVVWAVPLCLPYRPQVNDRTE